MDVLVAPMVSSIAPPFTLRNLVMLPTMNSLIPGNSTQDNVVKAEKPYMKTPSFKTSNRALEEKIQWCLKSEADTDKEWLVYIDAIPFVIGRADNSNLKLIDKRISRHHTEIYMSGAMLWIRDLDSKNGTFVNLNQIDSSVLLEPGDTISIGEHVFQVERAFDSESAINDETIAATISKKFKDLSSFKIKLRKLIDERNVIPYFQPIVRFSDMTAIGHEILGRVTDSDLPSSPAELLDIAEWVGFSSELSSLFREAGVEIGQQLPGSSLLFINTTPLEILEMDNLLTSLQRIHDMASSNKIVLEINEKAAADPNAISDLRNALNTMAMKLAFDDFGVGQTRLVELANISPDYLKFDISLIRHIHLAPKRLHQMISTFVTAAHDLGICTLAEGIEDPQEAEICQQLGFDLAQGYLFGKPAPINEIEINLEYNPGKQSKGPDTLAQTKQESEGLSNKPQKIIEDYSKTIKYT